mmetsp:Transcript_6493/g.14207  ORF Transcript_6493/g.14207 Transcript_6493/m.14207 type:complete len:88 (+) Transcript_6493:210-473(+)
MWCASWLGCWLPGRLELERQDRVPTQVRASPSLESTLGDQLDDVESVEAALLAKLHFLEIPLLAASLPQHLGQLRPGDRLLHAPDSW